MLSIYRCLQRIYFITRRNCDALGRLSYRKILLTTSQLRLKKLRNSWIGDTIIIVGNGPSLDEEQIALASNAKFIATNRAYQLFDPSLFAHGANGYLIVNDTKRVLEVLPALPRQFQQVVFGCPDPKYIYTSRSLERRQFIFAKCIWGVKFNECVLSLDDNNKTQRFSPDFASGYYPGHSIAFSAIQLAAYLGAKTIVLIGCDMSYSGASQYSSLIKLDRHGIGHVGEFDYLLHGRDHMLECNAGLKSMGITLLNATTGGLISEIPRISTTQLRELLQHH